MYQSITTKITNGNIAWTEITGKVRKLFKQLLAVLYECVQF